jgi:hypothetical protein
MEKNDDKEVKKLHEKALGGPDGDDIDDDEESSDSDYEYTGGDLCLYDCSLDDVDELIFIKETLLQFHQN